MIRTKSSKSHASFHTNCTEWMTKQCDHMLYSVHNVQNETHDLSWNIIEFYIYIV